MSLSNENAPTLNAAPKHVRQTKQNTYLIEMRKSLSPGPCRARVPIRKTTVSSDIEFTHLIDMHKSLSLCPCRARTHQLYTINPTRPIRVSRD